MRGVEDAELPQFSILGYETNDRKVLIILDRNVKYIYLGNINTELLFKRQNACMCFANVHITRSNFRINLFPF